MPLVKRAIEPLYICRSQLDERVKNELEGVVVNSLAGLIKQLSSLSKHAENLFGELFNEASDIFKRSATLNYRVEDLNKRLKQMDATVKEEVKVEDIVSMNHFKSKHSEDQQILSRQTLPTAVYESYQSCDPPPALNEFTQYRDDEKEGLKFYTDPTYFYHLWVEEQNELLEKRKKRERKKRRRNKDNQPKKEIRVAQKKKFIGADVEFRDVVAENNSTAQLVRVSREVSGADYPQNLEDSTNRSYTEPSPDAIRRTNSIANSKPSHAPPPPPVAVGYESPKPVAKPIAPPPPPPPALPPGVDQSYMPPQPPPIGTPDTSYPVPPPVAPIAAIPNIAPAPPPPPPPPVAPAPPPPPPVAPMSGGTGSIPAPAPAPPKPVNDPRTDLLSAIRLGKQLRKVEEQTQVEKKHQSHGNDVASILARRIAFELSDSESGTDDSDSDSDWDD